MTLTADDTIFTESTVSESSKTHSTAKASVTRLSHTLSIEHFKWMLKQGDSLPFIASQYFPAVERRISQFALRLFPKANDDRKSVEIGIANDNTVSANVHYKLALINESGQKCLKVGMY